MEKKELTYSATKAFEIRNWVDQSPPASVLHYLKVLELARLNNHLTISKRGAAL